MNLIVLEKGIGITSTLMNIPMDDMIQLTRADNLEQLSDLHSKDKIDLLLLDFDSFSNSELTYKKIRNENGTSNIPVIFISSRPQDMDKLLSNENYLDDILLKPINPLLLKVKIRSYLTRMNLVVEEYEDKIEKLKDSIKFFFPHELRTSLSNILGYTNVIHQMTDSQNELDNLKITEIHEMSTVVLNAGNYMQRIAENLILYSHLELIKMENKSGSELLSCNQNNTIEIINDAIFALTNENNRKNDLELQLTSCTLNINGYLFYKIIYELIDNALKFSANGSKIKIITTSDGNNFFLEIQDFGKGMMKKEISSIGAFRQFERNVYEQQGIGLGLTLAMKITEIFGGTFLIKSKKSEGTKINLCLPLGM
jgi:signal transduction histidine kinase